MEPRTVPGLRIREAVKQDTALILALIKELAEYEELAHEVTATEEQLREALFGARPYAEVVIADYEDESVGFALYFHNFSTFLGRTGIYLEDLYVRPSSRGKGIGRALLVHLAGVARKRNCGRLEWMVLDSNQPALEFYRTLKAISLDEWTVQRLNRTALDELAAGS
jgi:GNAT superfamily N-acetyltransferase